MKPITVDQGNLLMRLADADRACGFLTDLPRTTAASLVRKALARWIYVGDMCNHKTLTLTDSGRAVAERLISQRGEL